MMEDDQEDEDNLVSSFSTVPFVQIEEEEKNIDHVVGFISLSFSLSHCYSQ